jgi:hypothetical protein
MPAALAFTPQPPRPAAAAARAAARPRDAARLDARASAVASPSPAIPATEVPALPFTAPSLAALIQGNGFTLWHYRTADTRAAVSAAGYFAATAGALKPGDLMILHAADAMALLPIRTGPAFGPGVTLDGAVGPLAMVRQVAQALSVAQAAAAVVRTIALAPIAAAVIAGSTVAAAATVTGPVGQVVFTLRDRQGTVIPPARTVAVAGGVASTSFAAPPAGTGYTIRVEDAADPAIGVTSRSFTVGTDLRLLLQQDGFHLLLEQGGGVLKQ